MRIIKVRWHDCLAYLIREKLDRDMFTLWIKSSMMTFSLTIQMEDLNYVCTYLNEYEYLQNSLENLNPFSLDELIISELTWYSASFLQSSMSILSGSKKDTSFSFNYFLPISSLCCFKLFSALSKPLLSSSSSIQSNFYSPGLL